MTTKFEVQWVVDDTMPDGGDFDPDLCEYATASYRTIEGATKRGAAESEKSPVEWFTIREYERQQVVDDFYDWELVATWDEAGDRWSAY